MLDKLKIKSIFIINLLLIYVLVIAYCIFIFLPLRVL